MTRDPRTAVDRTSRKSRVSGPLALVPVGIDLPSIPLPRGVVTLGQSRSCDLVVHAREVRARHATLIVKNSMATVERSDPAADVRVNDIRVQRAAITPGDVLSIGAARFHVETRPYPVPAPDGSAGPPPVPAWVDLLERLYEWSRSGPLDRRGAMLGLLVERLALTGAAVVTLDPAGGIAVLNAWGEVADLLRAGWVLERLRSVAVSAEAPTFEHRVNVGLAVVAGAGGAPVALLARRLDPEWDPAILRLAARFFAHEHSRALATRGPERAPSELAFPPGMAIGRAPSMRRLYATIRSLADSALPVVLLGETGVGKGAIARLLHESSPRSHLSLVEIDCGAPRDSLAAALAAIGEGAGRRGRARAVGAVVLDEVGGLDASQQSALLIALNELAREAGTPASPPRVIATSNLDAPAAVARGELRSDLWYRLAGAVVEIPALRDRVEDVPLLFDHFLIGAAGPRRPSLSSEALHALLAHDWPGNLRELRWEAQRVLARAPHGQIGVEQLSLSTRGSGSAHEPVEQLGLEASFEKVEGRLIGEALRKAGGNLSQAARWLGISRPRLRRRMAHFGLEWLGATGGGQKPPRGGATISAEGHGGGVSRPGCR